MQDIESGRRQQAAQENITTEDPSTALAWILSGQPVRIVSKNFKDWLHHIEELATLAKVEGTKSRHGAKLPGRCFP